MFMGSNAPKRFSTSRTSNETYFGGNFRSISSANWYTMLSRVSPPPPPPSFGCTLKIVSNIPWICGLDNMNQRQHVHIYVSAYINKQCIYLWLCWFDRIYQRLDANQIFRVYHLLVNCLCNRYMCVNSVTLAHDSLCEIQSLAIITIHWTKHL